MLIALHQLLTVFPALLDYIPGIHVNDRLMEAVTDDPFLGIPQGTGSTGFPHVVANLTDVEGILQNIDHTFLVKMITGLRLVSMVIQISGDVVDVAAGGVHIEDLTNNSSFLLFDDRILIRSLGISQWHFTVVETLAGTGEHGTADFPGEIHGVEFILPFNDHFDEAAIHAIDQWLTDGYHIDAKFFRSMDL